MNLRHNRIIIGALLVIALAMSLSLWPWGGSERDGGVTVLVTRASIPAGTPITPEMVDERRLAPTAALDDLVTSEDVRRGITTVRSLQPNEALTFASVIVDPSGVVEGPERTSVGSNVWRTATVGLSVLSVLALVVVVLVVVRRHRVARRVSLAQGAANSEDAVQEDSWPASSTQVPGTSLLQWANHELTVMLTSGRTGDRRGMPLVIELSPESGIELLWTEPDPQARAPWQATDGGWSWRLDYDEQPPTAIDPARSALPMLVEVGSRLGRRLLLNLDALGSLAVDAPEDMAREFVQSIMDDLSSDEVSLAGRAIGKDHANSASWARQHVEPDVNARLADAIRAAGSSPSGESTSSPSCVDRRREPIVVLGTAADVDPTLLREVRLGSGICVLLLGRHPDVAATIRVDETRRGILEPFGLQFDCAEAASATSDGLAGRLEGEPDQLPDEIAQDVRAELGAPVVSALARSADDLWTWPEPQVRIRVLGAPEVIGYPQLGRIETSILAYLACHGGQRTADQIVNAVWNGRLVEPKTLWNKISKIRAVLGPELVPPRQPNSAKVTIADSVMTDVALLRRVVERSTEAAHEQAVALLLSGLQLIDGTPFDSADYEWAYESQQYTEVCAIVEAAAIGCARRATEIGDVDSARAAVSSGLRALPTSEVLYRERMRVEEAAGNSALDLRSGSELPAVLRTH